VSPAADPRRLAVLVSGGGRSLQNLAAEIDAGRLAAHIGLVIADRAGLRASEIAAERGLPHLLLRPRDCGGAEGFSAAVFDAVEAAGCGTVVLAGFLRFLPIPERWLGRVLNIHPALLPKYGGAGFYGDRVHAAVLAAGDRISGCTVHYVDNVYDHGPILLQREVPVLPGDDVPTLAARVFAAECQALPEAIRRHLAR
jgi:phosphoribosylglycinamide formyltransferase-1